MARGRPKLHNFEGYELGKSRLYTSKKMINGNPINLASVYKCAQIFAKANNLTASKETVKSGIRLTFTQLGEK